jgi:hypothetical protein
MVSGSSMPTGAQIPVEYLSDVKSAGMQTQKSPGTWKGTGRNPPRGGGGDIFEMEIRQKNSRAWRKMGKQQHRQCR